MARTAVGDVGIRKSMKGKTDFSLALSRQRTFETCL